MKHQICVACGCLFMDKASTLCKSEDCKEALEKYKELPSHERGFRTLNSFFKELFPNFHADDGMLIY